MVIAEPAAGVGNAEIEQDHAQCLQVYEGLLAAFERCEAHAAPYLNVVALFFHDLMRIVTGYLLLWRELQGPFAPARERLPLALHSFPYTGYRDLLEGIDLDQKVFRVALGRYGLRWKLSEYKRTAASVIDLLRHGRLGDIRRAWVKGPGVDPEALARQLTKAGFRADYRTPDRVPIPNRTPQLEELKATVTHLWVSLGLPGRPEIPAELVARHVCARSVEREPPRTFPYDVVLTGTLLALEYRFMAALARHHGVPAVSVSHGDGIEAALDEPAFGYGERTFPSVFVGYGEAGRTSSEHSRYRLGLYEQPTYVCADSNLIRALYRNGGVERLERLDGKRVIYVPSQFYGQHRYGPFHAWADQGYLQWQETLFQAFPSLILKRHPKEYFNPQLTPRNASRVLTGRLEDYLDQADAFVFDMMSGASSAAMATKKPVVYFNIGLRNFTERGATAIRERCVWIDVDPVRPGDLRAQLELKLREPKTNPFTPPFCLRPDGGSQRREPSVVEVCSAVAQGLGRPELPARIGAHG